MESGLRCCSTTNRLEIVRIRHQTPKSCYWWERRERDTGKWIKGEKLRALVENQEKKRDRSPAATAERPSVQSRWRQDEFLLTRSARRYKLSLNQCPTLVYKRALNTSSSYFSSLFFRPWQLAYCARDWKKPPTARGPLGRRLPMI